MISNKQYFQGGFALLLAIFLLQTTLLSQVEAKQKNSNVPSFADFRDSAHHWYDINEGENIIAPKKNQPRYNPEEVSKIADNILLYQKANGGWPKNYDMRAILTKDQVDSLNAARDKLNTTFDNGTTHSQIEYLSKAYNLTNDEKYKTACLRGIDFALSAQYANGGFPQFYPDISGYRKYITFNDDAMIGVLSIFQKIAGNSPQYVFVDEARRKKVISAYEKGIDCILKCQIVENGVPNVWCQQHDNIDFTPRDARKFEPAAICNGESSEIVLFLMRIKHPSPAVINSIKNAMKWFRESAIQGIKVVEVDSPYVKFMYHSTSKDKVVVKDSTAPRIWTRYYELGTHTPIFCNRDTKIVYSLAEVERERRTGYGWYTYDPESVFKKYQNWLKKNKLME
jgi:PelA/Pel-15E family pectate lyase